MKRILFLLFTTLLCISGLYAFIDHTPHGFLNVLFTVRDVQSFHVNETSIPFTMNYTNSPDFYAPQEITTSYNIISTGNNKRVLARLDHNMPDNTNLFVSLYPPIGAATMNYVRMDTVNRPLLTNISNVNQMNLDLHVRMTASLGASTFNDQQQQRVIYFTLTD